MKKIIFATALLAMLTACDEATKIVLDDNQKEVDSLKSLIDQKDREFNDLVGTLTEVQADLDLINEVEGRVNMVKDYAENNSTAQNIRENMEFIQTRLDENRKKIEELENKLKNSSINSAKMKEAIKKLTKQLEEKSQELETLKAQLAEKDVVIEELGNTVNALKDENAQVKQEKETTAEIAKSQDAQLNTAWYVYGTTKELKDQGILNKGEVLQDNYNKDYFTKIDIRVTNMVNFDSKSAELLTNHPKGSYEIVADSKGMKSLRITDAAKFWSVSKYLVVKVK